MVRTRKEKPIFRGLAIAVAGDLGGGQWTDTNIARWVGLREGRFAGRDLDGDVTHLVCSEGEFRRRGAVVKAALKRQRTCQIVTLDWLEDSMHRRKRLDEEPFSHLRTLKKEREKERRRVRFIKGLEQGVKMVNPNLYHLYRDQTFFQYNVLLARDDEENGIQGERYILAIHESNAKPHLYWFVAKYYKKKGDTQAKVHRPSNSPGLFSRAFAQFESFFLIKTGIPWAQRLLVQAPGAMEDKRLFRYTPPGGGKPVGWVPAEFVPEDKPEEQGVDAGDDESDGDEQDELDALSRLDENITMMDISQAVEDPSIADNL